MAELQGLDIIARGCIRGMVRTSVTKISACINELEMNLELSHTDRLSFQWMQEKLTGLDQEFKGYHFAVVALIKVEDELKDKQAILDNHDDMVACLFDRLVHPTNPSECEVKTRADPWLYLLKSFQHIERGLHKAAQKVSVIAKGTQRDRRWSLSVAAVWRAIGCF